MRLLRPAFFMTLSVMLVACSAEQPQQSAPPAPEVDVSTPITRQITEWDEYTGRFEAVKSVEIQARVSGYLDEVRFNDGQVVNKGDVLFVIDQRPFKIALQSAEARYDFAKKELERGKDLRAKNSISQEEVDRRTNELQQAEAALADAKLNLEFTEVKAPITGLVSRDLVNEGNLVNGTATNATLLTTIVSVDPIHFYFDAGERDLLKYIRLSQENQRQSSRYAPNPVQVRLQDEKEFRHKGVMDFVDNRIDQSTGTIQGRAILPNPGGDILPGIFGRVRLLSRENYPAVLIPDTAIGSDQSRKYVWVLGENNSMSRRYIEIGKLYTQELRVVESGLGAEDQFVVNGFQRTRPGMQVQPKQVDLNAQYPAQDSD